MTVRVRRFEDGDLEAIQRLNRRLERGNTEHRLYREDLSKNPHADLNIRPMNDALFVAVDGKEIRGGAWLREQYFWVDGARQRVGWMKYPVAESLIDKRYAGVPASMILQFLRQQPVLMALGMGGHDTPFARLLAGIRWQASAIPFFFRVSRPFRVLRGLSYLRRRWWVRWAMDVAAWSGMGWLAHGIAHASARRPARRTEVTSVVEPRFTPWADGVWATCREAYGALAVRDGMTLDWVYSSSSKSVDRIRVTREGTDVGWICTQMLPSTEHLASYFGDLKVGVLVDALSLPQEAPAVLAAGVRHLEQLDVDLVITYLSHEAWIAAARGLRFFPGPSTFAFYRSPQAEEMLVKGELSKRCHLTRSDGHGPV